MLSSCKDLLDITSLSLEVLSFHQVGDVIIVIVIILLLRALTALTLLLLQRLVALGQPTERGERVRSELVQDTRDELRQLFLLAIAVDGERVGGDRGVDCNGRNLSASLEASDGAVA